MTKEELKQKIILAQNKFNALVNTLQFAYSEEHRKANIGDIVVDHYHRIKVS